MKPVKIIIHTEPTKAQMNPDLMIDMGLLKMARHDGKSLPRFLKIELIKLLMDYRDFELGGANVGVFKKYLKYLPKDSPVNALQ